MRNKFVAGIAFSAALIAANAASAGDIGVYYLSDLGMSPSAFIKTFGTKSKAAEVQAEINANPEVLAELQARGIQIKNVILSKPAFDGSTIYYVK